MDPTGVLNNVVDDSGYKCQVGEQQDSMEYLMNFMERLEEGVGEDSSNITKHMRVSTYMKHFVDGGNNPHDSFLTTDDSDIARSISEDTADQSNAYTINGDEPKIPGYSHIDDSYFVHAATQEKPPIAPRAHE